MLERFLAIPLLLIFISASAQSDRVSDFESWNRIELDYKFKKDWALSFTEMYRLDNNASDYKNLVTQLGLSYELRNWISVSSVGRFTVGRKSNTWRWSPVVRLNHRLKKVDLDLTYRFKPDFEWEDQSSSARIRNRFKIRYKKKKNLIRPAIGIEFFHEDKKEGFELSRIRYLTALAFSIKKNQGFEIGYYIQQDRNTKNPEDDFILVLSYNYEI